jgi:L-alanine-DL-glutamate epimerase-like enolase superfamily enzyme
VTLKGKTMSTSLPQEDRKRKRLSRRRFVGRSLGVTAAASFWANETIEAYQGRVNTASSPSDLKITDVRVATVVGAPMRCPLLRIDTNQGISGYGEVRDGASPTYALMLKSRIVGENPCNVDRIFRKIKQFGAPARQAGGICGIEMALWDLAGKAYNVPCYELIGGKFRDKVRLYCDTTESEDPQVYGKRLKKRVEDFGFTFVKMDLGSDLVEKTPGALTRPLGLNSKDAALTQHFFTGFELTDKGVALMADYVGTIREVIGMDIPLAADHFGHIGVNSCIRLGRALEKYNMAWLEDMIPWQYTDQLKTITESINIPTCTGEDIYLKEPFLELCKANAVDIIHPDLASSGGLLETKKISDIGQQYGHAMAMHFAGTPVSFMANVHCATACENFLALEFHSADVPWWQDMVTKIEKPLIRNGFAQASNAPGLGIELNEEVIKQHLAPGTGYFEPTTQWDNEKSWDRLYS